MIKAADVKSSINGSMQVPSRNIRGNTLKALAKAGYHWRSCGGWTAISAPGIACPEPGEHVLDRDLGIIAPVIDSMPEGFSYWDLFWAVERSSGKHFKCCADFDIAIRFGVRRGRIAKAAWMRFIL